MEQGAIRQEFTQQSAIPLDLFEAAIGFIDGELVIDPITHEVVATPIHDKLGWKFTRFGHQARNLSAACFFNEDGSLWQAKAYGLPNQNSQRSGCYRAPKGNGNQPYFPPVPMRYREKIAKIYGVEPPPMSEAFWPWFLDHPEIPVTITEGGKKSLAALGQGVVTIALYGCMCGESEALKPFFRNRKVYIGLDRDTNKSAIKAVFKGIHKLSWAIIKENGQPRILQWSSSQGKGLDDLAVNGINLRALATDSQSTPYQVWKAKQHKASLAKYHQKKVNQRYLSLEALNIPKNAQIIGIQSAKGTGKTEILAAIAKPATAQGTSVLVIGHRVKLLSEMSQRFGLDYRTDDSEVKHLLGYCLCINSLHPKANPRFDPEYWGGKGGVVILDEIEQVIWSLLNDDTLKKHRTLILDTLQTFLRKTLENGGKIYLSDADLSSKSIDFILSLVGLPIDSYVIQNTYKSPVSRPLTSFESNEECLEALINRVKNPENKGAIMAFTGAQQASSKFSTTNLEKRLGYDIPPEQILRIDSQSISDPNHPAFRCTNNLNKTLKQYRVVICSPTLETGVSLIGDGYDSVFMFANGTQTVNGVCQSLARVRSDVPRFIFAAKIVPHNMRVGGGSASPNELIKRENILFGASSTLLQGLQSLEVYPIDGTNPEILNTWASYAAEINADSHRYRDAILEKLEEEGYTITTAEKIDSQEGQFMGIIKNEAVKELCARIAQAPNPDDIAYKKLQEKAEKTEEELLTEEKGRLTRAYLTDDVTPPLVEKDLGGWFSELIIHYYLTTGREFLQSRDEKKLTKLGRENDGKIFSVDANRATLSEKIFVLENRGIKQFLDTTKEHTKDTLQEWFESLLPYKESIRYALGFKINPEKDSPIAIAQKFLAKLGLKMECSRRRVDGVITRFYRLETLDPDDRGEVLARWLKRDLDNCDTPCGDHIYIAGGVTVNTA